MKVKKGVRYGRAQYFLLDHHTLRLDYHLVNTRMIAESTLSGIKTNRVPERFAAFIVPFPELNVRSIWIKYTDDRCV